MVPPQLFEQIIEQLDDVIEQSSELGKELYKALLELHPADIAQFLETLPEQDFARIFRIIPVEQKTEIFAYLSDSNKAAAIAAVAPHDQATLLQSIPTSDFMSIIDFINDEQLNHYFQLMRQQDREDVINRLKADLDTAGGIMDTNVITLLDDFTVQQAIHLLQRIKPNQELHEQVFVTDRHKRLIGYIHLRDLVTQSPTKLIASFVHDCDYVAPSQTDKADVARLMKHYHITLVPVIDEHGHFVGVIPSSTLIEIIEEEAESDVYRISAMRPIRHSYFETPFFKLLYDRSSILVVLLLVESFSSTILHAYENTIAGFLLGYITMLISTGGNSSSQTSALVIQGLAAGEINASNTKRFLKREILMAFALACVLAVAAFGRVYLAEGNALGAFAVATSIFAVVMLAISLGSTMPLFLQKMGIDPAFSAGPVLATIMDILGLFLYCSISFTILQYVPLLFR